MKLPCYKTLMTSRDQMVPSGLKVSATHARFPLQSVLNHTAKRLARRPDLVDFFDHLEDGATLQLLWKWGLDGQTGLAAYARSKDYDDRQCINEGVALIMGRNDEGKKFFVNDKSGGTQLYRLLSKMNCKESEEMMVNTIKRIQAEMHEIEDTVIHIQGKNVFIHHKVLLTMLNGKCRKAYTQDLLATMVEEGKTGLEKHGHPSKIDNRTCLYCLGHPDTYGDLASLNKPPVLFEMTKMLGVSCMHIKVRLYELLFHVGVQKMVKLSLDAAKENIKELNIKKGEKTKKIAAMKAALEKEATNKIQAKFQEPLGRGLRCLIPGPQKVQRATYLAHFSLHTLHSTPYT